MKTIVTSVIALLFAVPLSQANNLNLKGISQPQQAMVAAVRAVEFEQLLSVPGTKGKFAPIADAAVSDPSKLLKTSVTDKLQTIIDQDLKITESTLEDAGYFFFSSASSVEQQIRENNAIIESTADWSKKPLYLETTIEQKISEDRAITEADDLSGKDALDLDTLGHYAVLAEN